MLLETKAIIQFALLWGSTWVVASLAIASVLGMALVAQLRRRRAMEIRRPWLVGVRAGRRCWSLNYAIPIGRIGFESRALESLFYAVLDVQPDPLRRAARSDRRSSARPSLARDYGTNLLGAMVGGVGRVRVARHRLPHALLDHRRVLRRRRARPPGRGRPMACCRAVTA